MSDHTIDAARLFDLTGVICDEDASQDEVAELDSVVFADREACRRYLRYCRIHSALKLELRAHRATQAACQQIEIKAGVIGETGCGLADVDALFSPIPVPAFPPTNLNAPLSHLSSDWPLAYLVATVVFGIAGLIAAFTYVSQPEKDGRAVAVAKDRGASPPETQPVGQITGTVGCKWTDSSKAPASRRVMAGQQYSLASGLMEITYATGAKVIIEGPATYRVDARNGGFLSAGRLTGRVDDKAARGFTIGTPTAVVTDLGTEFGVEVQEMGMTCAYVFQGSVVVRSLASKGREPETVTLNTNESVRVSPEGGRRVQRVEADPSSFVRSDQFTRAAKTATPFHRWQTYSQQLRNDPALLAYYTFEAGRANSAILPNRSSAGVALDGHVEGAEWVNGRFPGKFALFFHGPGSGDKATLPHQDQFTFPGAFSIAVWFRVAQSHRGHEGLITKGDRCWRVQLGSEGGELNFGTNHRDGLENGLHGKTEVNDRRWHLGVGVWQSDGDIARKTVYVDGGIEAAGEAPLPLHRTDAPVWIGSNSEQPDREFHGWIDEVMIFNKALSAEEIRRMYDTGKRGEIRDDGFTGGASPPGLSRQLVHPEARETVQ